MDRDPTCEFCGEPFYVADERARFPYCSAAHSTKARDCRKRGIPYPKDRPPCPTPTKAGFSDQGSADERAALRAEEWRQPVRVYQCQCWKWHLTTKPIKRDGETRVGTTTERT